MSLLARHSLATDGGGLLTSIPGEVAIPHSTADLSQLLEQNDQQSRPVVTRGGGKTTEGESLANAQELMIHLRGMNRLLSIDSIKGQPTAWVQGGMTFQELTTALQPHNLSVQSAPLNLSASVGGTVAVGGIDVNSAFLGCVADQVMEMEVVLPNGQIKICSSEENADLFEDVLYGYGQFGVVSALRLPLKPTLPLHLDFLYYNSLSRAIDDLQALGREELCDQLAILSLRDDVVALIVGFENDLKYEQFQKRRKDFLGQNEPGLWLKKALDFFSDPRLLARLPFLWKARQEILDSLHDSLYTSNRMCQNRLAVFGKLIWKFWGAKPIVIPDVSVRLNDLSQAVLEGSELCKQRFSNYTLYIVLVKKKSSSRRYDLGPFPETQELLVAGAEFEPLLGEADWTLEGLQEFKDEIYRLAGRLRGRAYRFGGVMKPHVQSLCGLEAWQRFVETKKLWDPKGLLNPRVLQ